MWASLPTLSEDSPAYSPGEEVAAMFVTRDPTNLTTAGPGVTKRRTDQQPVPHWMVAKC